MPLAEVLRSHPFAAIALLFGAGVVTSFFPCIYPMIPITVGVIGGSAGTGAPRRRLVGLTLTYVLGVALLYATMGLVAGLTGSLFGTIGANPWVRLATANLLLLFALALLDLFPVTAPQRLAAWAGQLTGGSYGGVLLLGATSGIVAAPCGAPAFAAVLTWVAATHSAVLGFVYLFAFSLGMTVLLAVVGLFSGAAAALPRPGAWMDWVKRISGVILIGVAEYYLVQVGKTL
ncbi:MAG TPA: cytochrome c biogenesis protein CcdA [Gemmatimonadales bacterium]|nr:cytochrome c biogenesis protein CcdA [Gemmatimonadales bacterium]